MKNYFKTFATVEGLSEKLGFLSIAIVVPLLAIRLAIAIIAMSWSDIVTNILMLLGILLTLDVMKFIHQENDKQEEECAVVVEDAKQREAEERLKEKLSKLNK